MSFNDKINQPEGRRLEFKSEIPAGPEIAKTIIAFANDAGGELYIGVQDNPRNVLGLDEDDLLIVTSDKNHRSDTESLAPAGSER